MNRHPRSSSGALARTALLVTLAAAGLALPPQPTRANPYYEMPCRDTNGDRIEDFLVDTPEQVVDLYVVFEATGWNPVTARAQVQHALDVRHSAAEIVYVGQWSPYVFLKRVKFGPPKIAPLELGDILDLPHVVGLRAYERFPLRATRYGEEMLPATPAPPEAVVAAPPPAPSPVPVPPQLLVYFVDSGIDGSDQYWGIDAATNDPLVPKEARNPGDLSPDRHGTFVKHVAWTTLTKGLGGAPLPLCASADVRVGVGPAAETTTLELTRGFDAIVAHIAWERQRGHLYRPVVNVSYDTDGPIANHDIIYPTPGGPLDPRGAGATLTPNAHPDRVAGATPAGGGGPLVNPCDTPLFDNVFHVIGDIYDGVIVVGAGNDGSDAAFVINEVGLSTHVPLVVAAIDPQTDRPADYSCFGTAPDGAPQNGHPDLAAPGRTRAEGFDYELEGTSISTAFCSGAAAILLVRSPLIRPKELRSQLIAKGARLPDMGPRWYGQARLHLPGDRFAVAGPAAVAPPMLLFPGSGERLAVSSAGGGAARVRLFSVAGRLVRTLLDGELAPGRHDLAFDGRGEDGSPLPAGLYFVRATDPGGVSVTKLLIRR